MESGDFLFKGLFVGGYYFTNDIDKDATVSVGAFTVMDAALAGITSPKINPRMTP